MGILGDMSSSRLRALLIVPLLLLGGWLGALSDEARATPRPPGGAASLLGGFSAVAVQVFWIRGDLALRDRRMDEALYYFGLIHRLEPQLIAASAYFADEIGLGMADLQPDPAARAALAMLGVRVLDRTVMDNVDDARAYITRGHFLLTKIALEEVKSVRFMEERGVSAFAASRNDFRRAVELNPNSIEAMNGFALASVKRGEELFAAAYAAGDGPALAVSQNIFRDAVSAYSALIKLQRIKWEGDPGADLLQGQRGMQRYAQRFVTVLDAGPDGLDAAYSELFDSELFDSELFDDVDPAMGWPEPR